MCYVKYLTMTFPVGLPAKIDDPVPTSQVAYHFNNSVSLNGFALKAATGAAIVGNSSNDLELFIDRFFTTSTSSFSTKLKLNCAFPFFLVTVGEGVSQVTRLL